MKNDDLPFKGFLISCDKNKEKQALRDAYNFITDYIEQIYSDITQQHIHKKIKQEGKQITLETEVSYGKRKEVKLLTQVETHVNCMCFIKINPTYHQIDPLRVVSELMKDIHQQGKQITRYCHRILPVERAFRAEHFRMLDQLDELLNIHSQSKEIKSWMLNFKCRNNNKFNYKQVLRETQKLAKKYNHFPDIYYPQWAISIQISNHLMCLSICQQFKETNQYKLHKKIDKSIKIESKQGQTEFQKSLNNNGQLKRQWKRLRRYSNQSIQKEQIDFLHDKHQISTAKKHRIIVRESQKGLMVKEEQKQRENNKQVSLLAQKIQTKEDDVELF